MQTSSLHCPQAARLVFAGLSLFMGGLGCGDDAAQDDFVVDASPPSTPSSGSDAGQTGLSDAANPVSVADAAQDSDAQSEPPNPSASEGGPSGGDAGPSEADAATEPPAANRLKPKCMQKDSQLIVIGDSYINWISHTFPEDIKRESGQSWRMEAVGGTSMGSGGIGSIPQQFYDSIKRDPDAHTALMDGGGNDILVPDWSKAFFWECTSKGAATKQNCKDIVTKAIAAAGELRQHAAEAGIRDVVYFFYPHVPANTILSGDAPDEILDYALPMVRDFCDGMETATGGKTRCTFIDMIPVFEGHKDWFNEDIHPNSKGSAAMAKEIWRVMTEKCIGQKGPKDCCES